MFQKKPLVNDSPDLGGSFGGSSRADEVLKRVHGKEILSAAIEQGPGVLCPLNKVNGKYQFVIPLSGLGQGEPSDDAILSVGGLVQRFGSGYYVDRTAYPVRGNQDHWDVIKYVQQNEREHFATPFYVVGSTDSATTHPNLKQINLIEIGRRDYSHIGLLYPATANNCRAWANYLVDVVHAIESENGELKTGKNIDTLISDLKRHVRNDSSSEEIAKTLIEYEKVHGDRPRANLQVPEFIWKEKFK